MNRTMSQGSATVGRVIAMVACLLVTACALAFAAQPAYAATDGSGSAGKLQAASLGGASGQASMQADQAGSSLGLAQAPAVGTTFKLGGNVYKVTDEYENARDLGEVVLVRYGSSSLKPTVNTVKYKGATYEVERVGKNAFNNAKGHKITSVKLGKHVDAIGSKAFRGCSKLKTIDIAKSDVVDIDYSRKLGTYRLDDVNIGAQAFTKAGVKNVKVKCGSSNATYKKLVKKALVGKGLRSTATIVK